MAKIKVKGYEFEAVTVRDSFNRRATQFKNNIITSLKRLGLTADDVDIELEITALLEERITLSEFISEFSEDKDIAKKRKEARVVLGLNNDVNDLKVIDKAYKDLAKKHHPDTENGDAETFKEINHAHKILKRELM